MFLRNISLVNFKSFENFEFEFNSKIICFTGKNGVGKTNLIDAIYHLSYAKSYFNPIDIQNIRWNTDFYMIQALFHVDEKEQSIYLGLKKGAKKILKRNQKEYSRLSDHVGLLPMVVITPNDNILFSGGSEERRKFLDIIISQFDHDYLQALMHYNHVLLQRNTYLKNDLGNVNDDLLQVWDKQLYEYGNQIYLCRQTFVESFIPLFLEYYNLIAQTNEIVRISYQSQLNEKNLLDLLTENHDRDKLAQYTTVGIHKDELEFTIWDYSLKKIGSQGQQKTFLLALKLAQFFYIYKKRGLKPLLLLDDIFDKLDLSRVQQLMNLVAKNTFGQIFITDTNPNRVKEILNKIKANYQVIEIKQ